MLTFLQLQEAYSNRKYSKLADCNILTVWQTAVPEKMVTLYESMPWN